MRAALLDLVLPAGIYAAVAVWFTWPLAAVGSNHLVTSSTALLNDLYLVLWILTWVARALVTSPLHVFDGNALHPAPHVIAASEHLLGDMPIFAPIWLASDDAILGLNCLTLASFVLTALFMHVLVRRWTGSHLAAYVGALACAFAPWRADLGRPHLLQAQYFPLIVLGLDRTAATGRLRTALLTAGVLAIQVLCSYYLGYAAYLLVGTYLVVWVAFRGWADVLAVWRALAVVLLAPLVLIVPASIPYFLARSGGALATELSEPLLTVWQTVGQPAFVLATFVGWGTVVVGAAAVVPLRHAWRDDRERALRLVFLLVLALLALLLATGPAGILGGWISPYVWLTAVIPGFRSLRSPVRFGIVVSFAVSALAAYAAASVDEWLRGRATPWARIASGGALVALCMSWLWFAPPSFSVFPAPTRADVSPAHRWLAEHGAGGPLLELPIDPMLNLGGARAMFDSTYHWLPLVNGYTGYTPPGSAFLGAHAQQLPLPGSLQILVDCAGLQWVLVHRATGVRRDAWRRLSGVRLERAFAKDPESGDTDEIYRVLLPAKDPCPGLFTPGRTAQGNAVATVAAPRGSLSAFPPAVVAPNRERQIAVSLQNDGGDVWPATSVDPRTRFDLWYSWQPVAGGEASQWRRVLLPRDVAPGERVDLTPWIAAPREEGAWMLRLRAGQGEDPSAPLLWQGNVQLVEPPRTSWTKPQ